MRRMVKQVCALAVALTFLALGASEAFAQANGVSQYLAGKAAGTSPAFTLYNPTGTKMFALAIQYDDDEKFEECVGFVLTKNDTEQHNSSFSSGAKLLQVISVPTGGSLLFNPRTGLIGEVRKHRALQLINPALWNGPHTADQASFKECLCGQLNEFGLKPSIMFPFLGHVTCPNPS